MQAARFRLILATVLFALWLGYLGYLAWTTARPKSRQLEHEDVAELVLSHSQMLEADLDLAVTVDAKGNVTDYEVLWPTEPDRAGAINRELVATALKDSSLARAGRWLVPLVRRGDELRVAPVPPTPGFPLTLPRRLTETGKPRIYEFTPQTLAQERDIRKHYPK